MVLNRAFAMPRGMKFIALRYMITVMELARARFMIARKTGLRDWYGWDRGCGSTGRCRLGRPG